MLFFVLRDLWRNPRRTLASLVGVTLGAGLFTGLLVFIDATGATMTKRAIEPLALDIQSVLNAPLGLRLRFEERMTAPTPLRLGQDATFRLTVSNDTAEPVHEVVINDEPPPPLSYVPGTTNLDGKPIGDKNGQSPLAQGLARTGLNLGTVSPGERIELSFVARANEPVPSPTKLRLRGTVSSREDPVPLAANGSRPLGQERLQTMIRSIKGVAYADALSFVDLPPGTVHIEGTRDGRPERKAIEGPVRVFAFDAEYQQHYPSIRIVNGAFGESSAMISAEMAHALGLQPATAVSMQLPAGSTTVRLKVGGVVDLSRAEPLFTSRKARKLDEFLYMPFAVQIPLSTFRDTILPAYQKASAVRGTIEKNLPVSEVDVFIDRSLLRSDPAAALAQTASISRSISRIGPGQHYLIDNIANALAVARDDAAVGRRMFFFLGFPGMLLAAFLTAFGASIYAQAQRREQATLRLHGASARTLLRIVLLKVIAIAGLGALLGTMASVPSVLLAVGTASVRDFGLARLFRSALVGVGGAVGVSAIALYLPARRALQREVSDERKELAVERQPFWQRRGVDFLLVASAAIAVVIERRLHRPATTSVSAGEAASLPTRLLFAPLAVWLGGTLLFVRAMQWWAMQWWAKRSLHVRSPAQIMGDSRTTRDNVAKPADFGSLTWGTLTRSLRRRTTSLVTGTVGVALVVAFGTNLATFAATYERAKRVDSRFVVGSDLRIAPSSASTRPYPASYAKDLKVPGVVGVTPVVFQLENSVLIGPYDQDRTDLVAIQPKSFLRVSALPHANSRHSTAHNNMTALEKNTRGVLINASRADDLSIELGSRVQLLLARGTKQQALRSFVVVGMFDELPGIPEGADVVVNVSYYESVTRQKMSFYLARTTNQSPAAVERAVSALRSGPGRIDPLRIDTTSTTLNKDRSSLTAVNVQGLVNLGSMYATVMAAAAIAMVMFGLQLQRRKEYLSMRAYGIPLEQLFLLIVGESAFVAASGLVVGTTIGTSMALFFVRILRPLFVLPPRVTLPLPRLTILASALFGSTVVCAVLAIIALRRLRVTTVLRES
jgi:putative ABC transport system permease protein